MQIVFEQFSFDVQPAPPNPMMPEGGILIIVTESGTNNRFPLAIPKLEAINIGMRILALSKGGEGNGHILPPAEPVYGSDADDITRMMGEGHDG